MIANHVGKMACFIAVSQDLGKVVPGWRLSLLIPADARFPRREGPCDSACLPSWSSDLSFSFCFGGGASASPCGR